MTEFSALEKSIIKKYGDVLVPASIIGEQNKANLKIGPKLDLALCGGIPEGSRVVFSGPPKAQPLYSKILTPDGWRKMGDLEVGNRVSSVYANNSTITNIIPHGKKDVYEITLEDGSKTRCCLDHLWDVVINCQDRDVVSLSSILDRIKCGTGDVVHIPVLEPIYCKKWVKIKSIQFVGIEDCQCITVSCPTQLYITDDFIITHNCGKSTTILQICANAIKEGRKVFYYDVENRFKKLNLYGIRDFDAEKMRLIHSTEEHQLTAEEYLDIAKIFIKSKENKGSIHVIDSVSALCPDSVMTAGDVSGSRRSTSPKLVKDFMNQVAGVLPVMNITVIAIHHLIANTSGYGVSEMEDGGRNMQYQADVKVRGGTPKKWEEGEKQIGIIATWDVIWSALGPSPGKVESYIRFNYGIDDIKETVELATDFGILKKGGSWYDLASLGIEKKIQGDEQLLTYLKENPDLLKKIQEEFVKVSA